MLKCSLSQQSFSKFQFFFRFFLEATNTTAIQRLLFPILQIPIP